MKIALFGGAFDPPHTGHQLVASQLLEQGFVDQVWFVPVFIHPWADTLKKTQLSLYQDRVHMLALQLQPNQSVAEYQAVSYTYDTLEYFAHAFKEHSFSWVMGTEYVSKFELFLAQHPLLVQYQCYVYPRAGYPITSKQLYPNMTYLADLPEVRVSSTQIRHRVKVSKTIDHLVDAAVKQYIVDNNLYAAG